MIRHLLVIILLAIMSQSLAMRGSYPNVLHAAFASASYSMSHQPHYYKTSEEDSGYHSSESERELRDAQPDPDDTTPSPENTQPTLEDNVDTHQDDEDSTESGGYHEEEGVDFY